jgi:rhodanese-related sulfurtransferase
VRSSSTPPQSPSSSAPAQPIPREIVVCSVSSNRAIPTAERLARLGYDHVYCLDGGYAAWRRS